MTAPTQFDRPRDVDHRADIDSLGVVVYEMFTGHVPAGRFVPPSLQARVDARVDEIVMRALEREPWQRDQLSSVSWHSSEPTTHHALGLEVTRAVDAVCVSAATGRRITLADLEA